MKNFVKNFKNNDISLDAALRPRSWKEYIGQEPIKKNLQILLKAAAQRNEAIEHLLFYGPAGLGKTTIAHLIAKETGSQIKITSGPAIEKVGDLASILTNLSPKDILFIDEIHRLNKLVEEVLYPAMENRSLDIIIGKGPSARIIQLELPPFTLIAATTRIALLSSPLRSRFSGGIFRLNFYTKKEIQEILKRSAKILGINLTEEANEEIANRSRFTPRIANRLLKRCRDFSQINKKGCIDKNCAQETLKLLEIDICGLESSDRRILEIIINKFGGGPVGLKTIAAACSEEEATIENVYEPYLMQLGFLARTPKGRIATPDAYKHLEINHSAAKNKHFDF
jgi:Holliday junction DNA helicase RuvB